MTGCPAALALCGAPCGCAGRNPSHQAPGMTKGARPTASSAPTSSPDTTPDRTLQTVNVSDSNPATTDDPHQDPTQAQGTPRRAHAIGMLTGLPVASGQDGPCGGCDGVCGCAGGGPVSSGGWDGVGLLTVPEQLTYSGDGLVRPEADDDPLATALAAAMLRPLSDAELAAPSDRLVFTVRMPEVDPAAVRLALGCGDQSHPLGVGDPCLDAVPQHLDCALGKWIDTMAGGPEPACDCALSEPNLSDTFAGIAEATRAAVDGMRGLGATVASLAGHWSDCALHSGPAYPPGPCDCGGQAPLRVPAVRADQVADDHGLPALLGSPAAATDPARCVTCGRAEDAHNVRHPFRRLTLGRRP